MIKLSRPVQISLLWICLCAEPLVFALNWRWSNPLPHGGNVVDMISTNGILVQIAERGQIYSSNDLSLWIRHDTGLTNFLRSIVYYKNEYVISGESGLILIGSSLDRLSTIRLNTDQWLEGLAVSPNLIVAVGDYGGIYSSADGRTWTAQTSGTTEWLRSIAYGADRFVAVGENGVILASANGTVWQPLASPTLVHLNRVQWLGNLFWISGDEGKSFAYTPGGSFNQVITGATNSLYAAALQADERLVVGDEVMQLQKSGPWTSQFNEALNLPAPVWTYYAAVAFDSSFVVAGRTGLTLEGFNIQTSNGVETVWLPVRDSWRNFLWDLHKFPQAYVAVGDRAAIMSSAEGVNWSRELVPDSMTNKVFLGIGGRTNLAVAVGSGGAILLSPDDRQTVTNASGIVLTNISTLGIVWRGVSSGVTQDLQGIGASADLIVACGQNGTILTSSNGESWTRQTTPVTNFLSSVESYSGGWIAVGAHGTLLQSSDATNWTQISLRGATNWLFRTRNLDGKLFVLGQAGLILTSDNSGLTWNRQISSVTNWLYDITKINNALYVVGNQGLVLTSTNAIDWTEIGAPTGKSLTSAAQDGMRLVVAGAEGAILRAQIIPDLEPILISLDSSSSGALQTNTFLFHGNPDQRFTFDRSTNLTNWQAQYLFEFLDGSDLLFHQEVLTNPPPEQFFRATMAE